MIDEFTPGNETAEAKLRAELELLRAENEALRKDAEQLAYFLRRVIGDHYAPNDCYSTGPMTGTVSDHICPSCEGLKYLYHRAALQEPKP